MTKRNKIIYWVSTLWLASGMLATGTLQLFKVESGRSAGAARGIWYYTFGLSHLPLNDPRCLESFGRCSGAYSQISLTKGMGLCRLFLCHDGSRIFARRSGRSRERNISCVVASNPDGSIVVFQTCG